MLRRARIAAAVAALIGCRDLNLTEPAGHPPPVGIQPSVMVFGTTLIGAPLGGSFGLATAVNDLGQVVGQSSQPGDLDPPLGFLWTAGTVLPLRGLSGQTWSTLAADVNAFGLIVGEGEQSGGPGERHAIVWEGGDPTRLITTPFSQSSIFFAVGVNDVGQIIGGYVTGKLHALFWANKSADPIELHGILGSDWGEDVEAFGINNQGVIVGSQESGPGVRPVVWLTPTALPVPLLGPDGTLVQGIARSINDLGQIVGEIQPEDGLPHAAFWPGPAAPAVVLHDPRSRNSSATAINELGQIAGWASLPPPGIEYRRPVLWMPAAGTFTAFELFDLGTPPAETIADNFGQIADLNNNGQAVGQSSLAPSLAQLWDIPLRAALEITPAEIKLDGKGRVTATILGSQWFNAAGIDPTSLTLGNDDGNETAINFKKKLTPVATLVDQNRDGFPDLVAEFAEDRLIANGDLVVGAGRLVVLGRFGNGKHLWGAGGVSVAP